MSLLLKLLLWGLGILAPGYCLSRRWMPGADVVERAVHAAGLGLVAVPTLAFMIAWAFSAPFGIPLLLGTAAALVAVSRPWSWPARPSAGGGGGPVVLALALLSLAALEVTEIRYGDGHDIGYPCLHELTVYLHEHDLWGWPLYDPATGDHYTHIAGHLSEPVLGLDRLLEPQRTANGAALVTTMTLTGRAGLELMALLLFFIITGSGALLARLWVRCPWAGLAIGALGLVATHGLMGHMVNSSVYAMAGGMLVMALLARGTVGVADAAIAGAYMAFAVGSRQAALSWALPVALIVRGTSPRTWLAFGLGFAAGVFPWFAVPGILRGNPLFFPSDHAIEAQHVVFGFDFIFRPLNWPFVEDFVRMRGQAYPALFLVPLLVLRSAGAPLAALVLAGLCRRWTGPAALRWVAAAWALPISMFLLLQVYLDVEKTSWLLLAAPVVPMGIARAWQALSSAEGRMRTLIAWAGLTAALALLPPVLGIFEVPVDRRGYEVSELQLEPPPATEETRRDELARSWILPSLQVERRGHALWSSLAAAAPVKDFRSGRTILWNALVGYKDVQFPMSTTGAAPDLTVAHPVAPWEAAMRWERHFAVHLKLLSSERPTLRLRSRDNAFALDVDPGPKPHSPRHMLLFVDYEVGDGLPSFTVTRAGAPVDTRRYGFVLDYHDDGAIFRDLRIVSNVEPTPPETATWDERFEVFELSWTWRSFPNAERDEGIAPSEWRNWVVGGRRPRGRGIEPPPPL